MGDKNQKSFEKSDIDLSNVSGGINPSEVYIGNNEFEMGAPIYKTCPKCGEKYMCGRQGVNIVYEHICVPSRNS